MNAIRSLLATILLFAVTSADATWRVTASGEVSALGQLVFFDSCGAGTMDVCGLPSLGSVTQYFQTPAVVGSAGPVSGTVPRAGVPVSAEAWASANLAAGTLRARTATVDWEYGGYVAAYAAAGMEDVLNFQFPFAGLSTINYVWFAVSINGNLTYGPESPSSAVDFGAYFLSRPGVGSPTITDELELGFGTFTGGVALVGPNPIIEFHMGLAVQGTADYSHTVGVSITSIPPGGTYVSESGAFLTTAVPEASTPLMFALGIVLISLFRLNV